MYSVDTNQDLTLTGPLTDSWPGEPRGFQLCSVFANWYTAFGFIVIKGSREEMASHQDHLRR